MRVRDNARARRGISLFEAVAAVAIVGVTATAALGAVGAEMRTAQRARRAIEAEALATARLDFVSLMSAQQLTNLPDSVAKGTFDAPLQGYSWLTTAAPLAEQNGVYDVRVSDRDGRTVALFRGKSHRVAGELVPTPA